MKHLFASFYCILLCAVSAFAADKASFEVDGIGYSIISGTSNVMVCQRLNNSSYTGNITVPDTINYNKKRYVVTKIGIDAFRASTVKSVTLPNTLTEICGGAFNECSELIQAKIPSSVTTMGDCVFKKCAKLNSVTIPASVLSCSFRQMFAECTALTSVYINSDASLTKGATTGEWSMGTLTFMNCTNLMCVYMASPVPPVLKGDNGGTEPVVVNTDVDNIFSSVSAVTVKIPSGSKSAYEEAWGNGSWVNVTYVEDNAVSNVASVTVGGVTTNHTDILAAMAKAQSVSSATVKLLANVTLGTNETLSLTKGNVTLDLNGFTLKGDCKTTTGNVGALTVNGANLTITDGSQGKSGKIVHTASSYVCGVVANFGSLIVNSGNIEGSTSAIVSKADAVLTINGGSFMSSYATIDVRTKATINGGKITASDKKNCLWILPGGDVTLAGGSFTVTGGYTISVAGGKYTFKKGYTYRYTNDNGETKYGTSADVIKSSGEVVEEEFVVDGIRYVIIDGTSNVSVGKKTSGVYSGDVVIPSTVTYNGKTYTVTELGLEAFRNATITSISLPNTLTTIKGSAFHTCKNLTEVQIPSSVTTIMDCVFKDCTGLTSMTIPSTVTNCTFRQLFSGCSNLKEVYINCSSDNTTSPSTGEWSMGDLTFDGCSKLTSVYMQAEVAPMLKGAVSSTYTSSGYRVGSFSYSQIFPSSAKVYIPEGSEASYKTTWGCDDAVLVESTAWATPVDVIDNDDDNTDALYYDLSGRRVDANAKGIIIKKQGSKVTKYINR